MASCPKCGRIKLPKDANKQRRCTRCGVTSNTLHTARNGEPK
jgi:hypothetical protein